VAAVYFADSSALVKRYVQETGTSWVRRLTRRSPSTLIYKERDAGFAPVTLISADQALNDAATAEGLTRRRSAIASVAASVSQNLRLLYSRHGRADNPTIGTGLGLGVKLGQ
jgi:hypothetical protein